MARKIRVENSPEHIKKSVASLLVRRLLAEWVIVNVSIRRLAVREIPAAPWKTCHQASSPAKRPLYIPATLPPVEGYGLKQQDPPTNHVTRAIRAGLLVKARMWARAAQVRA